MQRLPNEVRNILKEILETTADAACEEKTECCEEETKCCEAKDDMTTGNIVFDLFVDAIQPVLTDMMNTLDEKGVSKKTEAIMSDHLVNTTNELCEQMKNLCVMFDKHVYK